MRIAQVLRARGGNLQEKIREANIELHRMEARCYEANHPEIFNRSEQRRIEFLLTSVDRLIDSNHRKALDFGAGTGNLTGKLLQIGYKVTAVDISREMCEILSRKYADFVGVGALEICATNIEGMDFDEKEFDLITCYSVLHHLPDYVDVIRRLSFLLKKGGVMYLDHEPSPNWWNESGRESSMTRNVYSVSSRLLNFLVKVVNSVPKDVFLFDYNLSDYWTKKARHIDHSRVRAVFEEENFTWLKREDYYSHRTRIFNPISIIHRRICEPDMSLWIAKK